MQAPAKTVIILDRRKVFLHAHLINISTYLRHSFKCKAIKNKKRWVRIYSVITIVQ